MSTVEIKTNHHVRHVLDGSELTLGERDEFSYLDWDKIDDGTETAIFFRHKGELYDLGAFLILDVPPGSPFANWDGVHTDSVFSALVVRWTDRDCETLVVGSASW